LAIIGIFMTFSSTSCKCKYNELYISLWHY